MARSNPDKRPKTSLRKPKTANEKRDSKCTQPEGLMIVLLLLMGLLFPFSAVASDTGLICAIDIGEQ